MASTATVSYDSAAKTVLPAVLGARMLAPVLPRDVLIALSLRVTADAIVAGPITSRIITFSFIPSAVATAVPVVSNTGRIASMTMAGSGLDYVTPPGVGIVDPNRRLFPLSIQSHTDGLPPGGPDTVVGNLATFRSFLLVRATAQVSGGAGYTAGTTVVTFLGGLPPAGKLGVVPEPHIGGTDLTLPPGPAVVTGCVRSVNIPRGQNGLGYPPNTQVFFIGGGEGPGFINATGTVVLSSTGRILDVVITDMGAGYTSSPLVVFSIPSPVPAPQPARIATAFAVMAQGRPARATATVVAGVVTLLTLTDFGAGYIEPPTILIVDPGQTSAAIFTPRMGVERIDVICPGTGYNFGLTAANVIITPAFKQYFPDTSDQRAPFHRLFEVLIATSAQTPIYSERPLLTP